MSGSYDAVGARVIATTEKAVLLRFDGDDAQHWVPRSQCEEGEDLEIGDDDIRISRWFIRKNL